MRKQPELTAQTKATLIGSFWSLYRQKKIEHITIKEITAKAGYHRSTFYEYFVDIYDVLYQLEDSLLDYIKEQVLSALEGGLNDDFIQKLADVYESKGDYLGTLLGEKGDPYFARKLKGVMRPALVAVFGLPENDIRTAYIFEFGMSAIIGTVTYWYQSRKDFSSKDMVQLLRSMLLSGIYPQIQAYSSRSLS